MVGRNQKGQILVESVFLMFTFVAMLIGIQALVKNHQDGIKKYKLSTEISRNFKNETTQN